MAEKPKRELILEEWNRYVNAMYSAHLPLDQADQLRKAFFAGASAVLKVVFVGGIKAVAEGQEEKLVDRIREVREELNAFAATAD